MTRETEDIKKQESGSEQNFLTDSNGYHNLSYWKKETERLILQDEISGMAAFRINLKQFSSVKDSFLCI